MEEELTETLYQRDKRRKAEKAAKQQQELETAFARRHELQAKDRDNAAMGAADDSALRARRIKELATDVKRQNYYKWIAALTAQKKYKEKKNGRIS